MVIKREYSVLGPYYLKIIREDTYEGFTLNH